MQVTGAAAQSTTDRVLNGLSIPQLRNTSMQACLDAAWVRCYNCHLGLKEVTSAVHNPTDEQRSRRASLPQSRTLEIRDVLNLIGLCRWCHIISDVITSRRTGVATDFTIYDGNPLEAPRIFVCHSRGPAPTLRCRVG